MYMLVMSNMEENYQNGIKMILIKIAVKKEGKIQHCNIKVNRKLEKLPEYKIEKAKW